MDSSSSTSLGGLAPSADDPLGTVTIFTLFENQRWYPLRGWSISLLPTDRSHYSDKSGRLSFHIDRFPLPPGYAWNGPWEVHKDTGTDSEGWTYAVDFPGRFHKDKTVTSMVRRRRWYRQAERRRTETLPVTGNGDDFVEVNSTSMAQSDSSALQQWRAERLGNDETEAVHHRYVPPPARPKTPDWDQPILLSEGSQPIAAPPLVPLAASTHVPPSRAADFDAPIATSEAGSESLQQNDPHFESLMAKFAHTDE
jgi:hypothetical protein